MADHPRPEDAGLDEADDSVNSANLEDLDAPANQGPRRGSPRPLLALASLIPLLAAVGLLALAPGSEPETVTRAESTSRPGPEQMWCPGPVQLPDPLLDEGPDADLSVTPPSPTIDAAAVALEPASSLLFGTVSGAETLQEDDGSIRAPQISTEAAEGTALDGEAAAQDLGVSVRTDLGLQDGPRLTAATSEGTRPVADAVQSTLTTAGDYRSLSVTRCARPATDASFLGVSSTSGTSSALVLRNPGSRAATASVQVWTEDGPAAMDGRSQVVVPPGEEEQILLESVAPGHEALGVDVSVLGAPLAMHVQSTERDGLTPGGAEIVTALPPPAQRQVMPAVDVAGTAPTLVLANPSGDPTRASVEVYGPEGPVEAAALEGIDVPGGAVAALPLDGLPDGTYSVAVEADDEVLTTTRSTATGTDLPGDTVGAPVDFTLSDAAPAIGAHAVTALPAAGAHGYLVLAAVADTTVTLIPIAADGSAGEPVEVTAEAGTSTPVTGSSLAIGDEPPAGIAVVPADPGAVHGAWMQRDRDEAGEVLISALTVQDSQNTTDAATVRLGE